MKTEYENVNGDWIAIYLNDPNIEEKVDMKPENHLLDASKGLVNLQVTIPPSYDFQGYFWGTSIQNMFWSV